MKNKKSRIIFCLAIVFCLFFTFIIIAFSIENINAMERVYYGCQGISDARRIGYEYQGITAAERAEYDRQGISAAELDDYDYGSINEQLYGYGISFEDISRLIIGGRYSEAVRLIGQAAVYSVFGGFSFQRELVVKLLLLGIVGAIFKSITSAFLEAGSARTGEYIVQIALICVLTSGTVWAISEMRELTYGILDFMEALIPTYALIVVAGCGSATAIAFYELVMFIIYLVDKIILNIVLPGISIYMMINMMNYISKDGIFGRLCELIAEMLGWVNKTLFGIVIGLNIIKGLISPILDSLKGTVFNKAVNIIPGIGGVVGGAASVVLGSGALIKNTVGVAAMLVLIMLCIVPVLKIFVFTYGCKAAGAMLEPVADKNYTDCINGMHEGLKLMLVSTCSITILFILTIAVVCASSNAVFFAGT